mmetsp:Transcript_4716/g.13569  ORF Transcript_4716/g.13569 Transcript_4716/m.13569 type:complete len:229 (+) Transcript_4716:232-918(+)
MVRRAARSGGGRRHDRGPGRRKCGARSPRRERAAGVRGRGCGHPEVLLPPEAVDRRKLQDVSGGGGKVPQAGGVVRHAGQPGHEHQDQHAAGQEGAGGCHGVFTRQPPARLSDLRPGGRVRPAGPGHGVWVGQVEVHRGKADRGGQEPGAARQDGHDQVHSLHEVRAVRQGGGGHRGPGRDREGSGRRNWHLCAEDDAVRALGQCGRPLPGRGTDVQANGLYLPELGA